MSNFRQRTRLPLFRSRRDKLPEGSELTLGEIIKTWYPLALSWIILSLEGVMSSAFLARMVDPEVNLAAYGSIAFTIAFVISSPIAMSLSGSVALSKDWASFLRLRRFFIVLGSTLTLFLAIVVFTPLYDWVVVKLIGAPAEVIEPGRIGLTIMLPFPWLAGYRRFLHGVLIRFGHSSSVTMSTVVRIVSESLLMLAGFLDGRLQGVVVATGALTIAMILETGFTILRARPVIKYQLRTAPPVETLTWKELFRFYIPLAMTTIIGFSFSFINSAGLSRMPLALESLAVFPVASGFVWLLQGPGIAYNEVVVALADRGKSFEKLRKFTIYLLVGSLSLTLVFLGTPLSKWWFNEAYSLSGPLSQMAEKAMWIFLVSAGIVVLQSWFQGLIVYGRNTRSLTESIIISLCVEVAVIFGGVAYGGITGVYVGAVAYVLNYTAQVTWLWLRSRPVMQKLRHRDGLVDSSLQVSM